MIVDADERVTPELGAEIRRVLATPPDDVDGYWIGRKNHFLGYHIAHCGWDRDDVLRLFRRDVGRYRERWVHAEIDMDTSRVRRLRNPLEHFTTWSSDEYWRKINRYASWGALEPARRRASRELALDVLSGAAALLAVVPLARLGFLDGMPGLHICAYTAFYTFMKQARLWELEHAKPQPDPEADSQPATFDLIPFGASHAEPASGRRAHAA